MRILIFTSNRRQGGITDEALCDRLLSKLSAALDVYDLILGKQKYLAGDVRIWFDTRT